MDLTSFIKIGKQSHMEDLFNNGTLYCQTIQFFRLIESENLRKDPYEGAAFLKQAPGLELYIDGKLFGKAASAQLYSFPPEDFGNIFCMYGIKAETLLYNELEVTPFNLSLESLSFDDYMVFIYDPGEFIERVKNQLDDMGLKMEWRPVDYYDPETYEGILSPFQKSNQFEGQNEVRILIPNKCNEPLVIKIGNISDISLLIHKDNLWTIGYKRL